MTAVSSAATFSWRFLDLQQQGDSSEHPLGRSLFGLEVESPDEGRSSDFGLVDGTVVNAFRLHFLDGNRADQHDGHGRRQVFRTTVYDRIRA